MAIYEYRCPRCGTDFEVMRPISKTQESTRCPSCSAECQRLVLAFAHTQDSRLRLPEGPSRTEETRWEE